jgi:hypothetical protein
MILRYNIFVSINTLFRKFIMNTFNYFIIGILLLSTQALAIRPIATKLERISVDTFRLTMDQPVQGWEDFLQETTDPYLKYRIFHGETNYLGNKDDNTTYVTKYITPINPNDRFTIQWEWKETAVLVAMDNDNLEEGTADMVYGLANSANEDPGETSLTFSLTEYLPLLAITTDNLTVNEKTQTVATLISNQNGATFSLDGSSDNNDLFKNTLICLFHQTAACYTVSSETDASPALCAIRRHPDDRHIHHVVNISFLCLFPICHVVNLLFLKIY